MNHGGVVRVVVTSFVGIVVLGAGLLWYEERNPPPVPAPQPVGTDSLRPYVEARAGYRSLLTMVTLHCGESSDQLLAQLRRHPSLMVKVGPDSMPSLRYLGGVEEAATHHKGPKNCGQIVDSVAASVIELNRKVQPPIDASRKNPPAS